MGLPLLPLILHRPYRLCLAVCAIGVTILLMFVQLGFLNGIADSQANLTDYINGDLVLVHHNRSHLNKWDRLVPVHMRRAASVPGVSKLIPVYKDSAQWRIAETNETRRIIVFAFPPGSRAFRIDDALEERLKVGGRLLFDRRSRDIYGSVQEGQWAELDAQKFQVAGLVEIGPNLVNDGMVILSEGDWLARYPHSAPMMAVIRLDAGADPETVAARIDNLLAGEAIALSPDALHDREVAYTREVAPVGLLFGFGLLVCLTIGAVICYQIQLGEIQEMSAALTTLRAIGFTEIQVAFLIVRHALLYALGSFLLALPAAFLLYGYISHETRLVLALTPDRIALILALVLLMGALAGAMSARRLLRADPADLF